MGYIILWGYFVIFCNFLPVILDMNFKDDGSGYIPLNISMSNDHFIVILALGIGSSLPYICELFHHFLSYGKLRQSKIPDISSVHINYMIALAVPSLILYSLNPSISYTVFPSLSNARKVLAGHIIASLLLGNSITEWPRHTVLYLLILLDGILTLSTLSAFIDNEFALLIICCFLLSLFILSFVYYYMMWMHNLTSSDTFSHLHNKLCYINIYIIGLGFVSFLILAIIYHQSAWHQLDTTYIITQEIIFLIMFINAFVYCHNTHKSELHEQQVISRSNLTYIVISI